MTLNEVALEIGRRMCNLFLPDRNGNRAVYDGHEMLQRDPAFREYVGVDRVNHPRLDAVEIPAVSGRQPETSN